MVTPLLRLSLALSGLMLALSACAEESDPTTDLVIEVRHSAEEPVESFTLTCDPVGGSHPTAEKACSKLADIEVEDLQIPAGTACAQVYGGPQSATVRGLLHGREVNEQLSRSDSCRTGIWELLGQDVLPVDLDWQN